MIPVIRRAWHYLSSSLTLLRPSPVRSPRYHRRIVPELPRLGQGVGIEPGRLHWLFGLGSCRFQLVGLYFFASIDDFCPWYWIDRLEIFLDRVDGAFSASESELSPWEDLAEIQVFIVFWVFVYLLLWLVAVFRMVGKSSASPLRFFFVFHPVWPAKYDVLSEEDLGRKINRSLRKV